MVKKQYEFNLQSFEALAGEKYIGIADCHGIESFLPYEIHKKDLWALKIRAMANRQRHAVAFLVALKPNLALQINEKVNKSKFQSALIILKSAQSVYFPENYGRSWDLIPNPDLDPWRR